MKQTKKLLESSRKINWIASADPNNNVLIKELGYQMEAYYKNNQYYEDITPATLLWQSWQREPLHRDIIQRIRGKKVLEVGCGKAEILSTGQICLEDYCGTDFSDDLMKMNSERFPGSDFRSLKAGGILPFEDNSFDAVFSLYVLEHAVNPALFLRENMRVLRPGGVFILLCPDFLGRNRMTSQRVGLSFGSGRVKMKQRRFLDALLTSYDNRIRIPLHCIRLKQIAREHPQFFINLNPICFTEKQFSPDVDAVYVTYDKEIMKYLENDCAFEPLGDEMTQVTESRRLIYLVGIKK